MVNVARFTGLWERTGGSNGNAAWLQLNERYSEDHRAYHGWIHIGAMLTDLDSVRFQPDFSALDLDEVELAIFFHDVIYDPRASDNEARSAAVFREAASAMPPDRIDRVTELILATARHEASVDPPTRLLLDLDLAILGATPNEYRRYDGAIRAEYEHVPQSQWRTGRSAVLEKFLARPVIYQTAYFHDRLENTARQNLTRELDALAS